jgi:hypothetical protein
MEEWLFDHEIETFTSRQLAPDAGITRAEASRWIGAYLDAQRSPSAATLYVLKREGRTTSAIWSVGQRTTDARIINGTLFEDVKVKVRQAWEPDLRRLATKNPRAARYVEAKLGAVIDGALVVLAAALDTED